MDRLVEVQYQCKSSSHYRAALRQGYKAVQMNSSTAEWFRTTVEVRRERLLSHTLFNIFLEQIMTDALKEHDGKVRMAAEISTICGLQMT